MPQPCPVSIEKKTTDPNKMELGAHETRNGIRIVISAFIKSIPNEKKEIEKEKINQNGYATTGKIDAMAESDSIWLFIFSLIGAVKCKRIDKVHNEILIEIPA